jgi:serine/threonine protein phosphatase 1
MRILAIGDIHGCSKALTTLLAAVAPQPDDLLIALGDFVDRGPDSRGVLDLLIDLKAKHRLVALKGNHEQMMMEARDAWNGSRMWQVCGGRATLASYGSEGKPGDLSAVPEAHWKFLDEELVDYLETDRHFFVHASAYYDIPLDEQPWDMLRWERLDEKGLPHVSGKVMVCGHTKQPDGVPLNLGHAVCIDTGVYDEAGWLTCLEVGQERYWQANQRGELREAWLL